MMSTLSSYAMVVAMFSFMAATIWTGIRASVYFPPKCCGLLSFEVHFVHRYANCLLKNVLLCVCGFSCIISTCVCRLRRMDQQKYEVEFLLQQQWYDPRLRYANQSQYEYLNAIHHHEEIWLPDTYFIMHGDFKDPIIPMHFALRIYRNGTINYLMRFAIIYFMYAIKFNPFGWMFCTLQWQSHARQPCNIYDLYE